MLAGKLRGNHPNTVQTTRLLEFCPHPRGAIILLILMIKLMTMALVAVLLPVFGAFVFRRLSRDYVRLGQLTRTGTVLQVGLFTLHGASSYVFLDSRLSTMDTSSPLFGFALLLVCGGLILLLSTMGSFGIKRAVGQEPGTLVCTGMYRRSRNPQLVFYGLAVAGYSFLWPSWTGAIWVLLYAALAQMMVRTEETHLKRIYGNDYVDYCTSTPRYLDIPGMK